MERLKKIWKKYPPTTWLVCALLIIGIIGVTIWAVNRPTKVQKLQRSYVKQLGSLDSAVKGLPKTLSTSGKPQDNLNTYFDQLDKMLVPCGQLNALYDKQYTLVANKNLKKNMSDAHQLCSDLSNVVKYSQNVYAACQDYIYFARKWPAVTDPAYLSTLQDIQTVLDSTASRLNDVDNSKVQDPALTELEQQVDDAAKKASELKSDITRSDFEAAGKLSDIFIKQINQDKIDFLSARLYYWQNTIELNNLQRSVEQLQNRFK